MTAFVDYDLVTHQIMKIIVPDDDAEIKDHELQSGQGRISIPTGSEPYAHSLERCARVIYAATGVWPPNVPQ